MASRRTKLISLAAVATLGAAGYFIYSVFAVQGQGALAQAPLNNQVQIPPAFIMAVDDSGSMSFETLFTPQDGTAFWGTGTAATNGYFNTDGTFRTGGTGNNHHLIPHSGSNYRIGTNRYAIPPIDNFGFARSHEYNPQYYDPAATYQPWLLEDGSPYTSPSTDTQGNMSITAARVDPRNATPTIDFTAQREEAGAAQLRFRALNQMRLPAGTRIYAPANCGGLGTTPATRNTWITLGAQHTMSADCEIGISYFPAVFYLKADTPIPAGYRAAARVGPIANAGGPGVSMYRYEIRPANYDSAAAYNAAIRNFVNWFSYYGNRNRSMIASMTQAFVSVNNMRVGYFTINSHASRANPLTNAAHRVAMYDMAPGSGERTNLYDQMISLPIGAGTPNRQAVQAMGQQFRRTDAGAPVQLACQKNVGMLFTDGYSNTDGPTVGNVDGDMGPPFADSHSNTLADIATQYYLGNLRADLTPGLVPVPAGCSAANPDPALDCNTNPHMNFYGITLGATGASYGVTHFDVAEGYTNPPAWPARTNNTPATVDDIWHATINTRGEYINAYTPEDVTSAMRRILAAAGAPPSPSGSLALTGARIGTGSLSVEPQYAIENDGTDWYSRLRAYTLTLNPATRAIQPTLAWEAANRLQSTGHASRRIWVGRNTGAQAFNTTNVAAAELCNSTAPGMSRCNPYSNYFGPDGNRIDITHEEAIRYLRGDFSLEVRNGGKLRDRSTLLGNIINSTPTISAPTDDYGYRSLSDSTLASSYQTYLTTKRNNHRVMVYAGANDGMLHAFDGGMGANGVQDGNGGVERFAYIPQAVLGHMGNLLFPYVPSDGYDQKFQHRYFVDGPITVGDARIGTNWRTVLVGTTGAGGRSVFALDVTTASTGGINPFNSAARLWEINNTNTALHATVRSNIGHVLGRPVIVPYKTAAGATSFKAIFGNGYNSTSGKAVLFVVDIDTGTPTVRMIEAVESGTGVPAGSNGLGNIVVIDRWSGTGLTSPGRDGFADTVYAADQRGAVWKFDLRNDLPAGANGVGSISTPLFVTRSHSEDGNTYRQPILGGLTAAAGPAGGVMLYFGTGSFSFVNDPSDTSIQSIYGVLDRGNLTSPLTREDLLEQTVTGAVGGPRQVTTNTLAFANRGWFLDLPPGERAVGYPRVESGIIFIPTYSPTEADGCSTAGFNSLFGLNALSGGAALSNVRQGTPTGPSPAEGTGAIALDTGGSAPVKDVEVMTTPRISALSAGADPDELAEALAAQCSMVIQVAGAPPMYLPRACGRQSWRQIQ